MLNLNVFKVQQTQMIWPCYFNTYLILWEESECTSPTYLTPAFTQLAQFNILC